MTRVRYLKPENRLGKLVRRPDGILYENAMRAAAANIKSIEDELLASLDGNLAALFKLAGTGQPGGDPALQQQLYQRAYLIAGEAGHCGLAELGAAAFSLCELLDRAMAGAGLNAGALAVHLQALTLLRQGAALPAADRQALVAGLHKVTSRMPR